VFEEWLAEYKKDESPNHKAFFAGYLKKNYEDFAAYRGVAESGGNYARIFFYAQYEQRCVDLVDV